MALASALRLLVRVRLAALARHPWLGSSWARRAAFGIHVAQALSFALPTGVGLPWRDSASTRWIQEVAAVATPFSPRFLEHLGYDGWAVLYSFFFLVAATALVLFLFLLWSADERSSSDTARQRESSALSRSLGVILLTWDLGLLQPTLGALWATFACDTPTQEALFAAREGSRCLRSWHVLVALVAAGLLGSTSLMAGASGSMLGTGLRRGSGASAQDVGVVDSRATLAWFLLLSVLTPICNAFAESIHPVLVAFLAFFAFTVLAGLAILRLPLRQIRANYWLAGTLSVLVWGSASSLAGASIGFDPGAMFYIGGCLMPLGAVFGVVARVQKVAKVTKLDEAILSFRPWDFEIRARVAAEAATAAAADRDRAKAKPHVSPPVPTRRTAAAVATKAGRVFQPGVASRGGVQGVKTPRSPKGLASVQDGGWVEDTSAGPVAHGRVAASSPSVASPPSAPSTVSLVGPSSALKLTWASRWLQAGLDRFPESVLLRATFAQCRFECGAHASAVAFHTASLLRSPWRSFWVRPWATELHEAALRRWFSLESRRAAAERGEVQSTSSRSPEVRRRIAAEDGVDEDLDLPGQGGVGERGDEEEEEVGEEAEEDVSEDEGDDDADVVKVVNVDRADEEADGMGEVGGGQWQQQRRRRRRRLRRAEGRGIGSGSQSVASQLALLRELREVVDLAVAAANTRSRLWDAMRADQFHTVHVDALCRTHFRYVTKAIDMLDHATRMHPASVEVWSVVTFVYQHLVRDSVKAAESEETLRRLRARDAGSLGATTRAVRIPTYGAGSAFDGSPARSAAASTSSVIDVPPLFARLKGVGIANEEGATVTVGLADRVFGTLVSVNGAMSRLLGFSHARTLLGRNLLGLFPEGEGGLLLESIRADLILSRPPLIPILADAHLFVLAQGRDGSLVPLAMGAEEALSDATEEPQLVLHFRPLQDGPIARAEHILVAHNEIVLGASRASLELLGVTPDFLREQRKPLRFWFPGWDEWDEELRTPQGAPLRVQVMGRVRSGRYFKIADRWVRARRTAASLGDDEEGAGVRRAKLHPRRSADDLPPPLFVLSWVPLASNDGEKAAWDLRTRRNGTRALDNDATRGSPTTPSPQAQRSARIAAVVRAAQEPPPEFDKVRGMRASADPHRDDEVDDDSADFAEEGHAETPRGPQNDLELEDFGGEDDVSDRDDGATRTSPPDRAGTPGVLPGAPRGQLERDDSGAFVLPEAPIARNVFSPPASMSRLTRWTVATRARRRAAEDDPDESDPLRVLRHALLEPATASSGIAMPLARATGFLGVVLSVLLLALAIASLHELDVHRAVIEDAALETRRAEAALAVGDALVRWELTTLGLDLRLPFTAAASAVEASARSLRADHLDLYRRSAIAPALRAPYESASGDACVRLRTLLGQSPATQPSAGSECWNLLTAGLEFASLAFAEAITIRTLRNESSPQARAVLLANTMPGGPLLSAFLEAHSRHRDALENRASTVHAIAAGLGGAALLAVLVGLGFLLHHLRLLDTWAFDLDLALLTLADGVLVSLRESAASVAKEAQQQADSLARRLGLDDGTERLRVPTPEAFLGTATRVSDRPRALEDLVNRRRRLGLEPRPSVFRRVRAAVVLFSFTCVVFLAAVIARAPVLVDSARTRAESLTLAGRRRVLVQQFTTSMRRLVGCGSLTNSHLCFPDEQLGNHTERVHDEIRLLNEALVGSASASDELAARIRLLTEGNACVALPTIDAVECASLASGVATFGLQTVVEELLRRSNSQLAVWEMQPSWEASRSVLLSADAAATRDLEARVLAPGLLAVEELFLQWAVDRADRAEDLVLGLLIALLILTLVLEVAIFARWSLRVEAILRGKVFALATLPPQLQEQVLPVRDILVAIDDRLHRAKWSIDPLWAWVQRVWVRLPRPECDCACACPRRSERTAPAAGSGETRTSEASALPVEGTARAPASASSASSPIPPRPNAAVVVLEDLDEPSDVFELAAPQTPAGRARGIDEPEPVVEEL